MVSITVSDEEPPTQRPALLTISDPSERPPEPHMVWRPVVRARSNAVAVLDEKRRSQAVVLFRALRDAAEKGLAWRECWALCEDVGPVIVWMRARGVEVSAVYDVGGGETRFYIA